MDAFFTNQQTVRELARQLQPVSPQLDNQEVLRLFEANEELNVLPVVVDGRPVGILSRHYLMDHFARPYCRELYGRKPCTHFMNSSPLLFDQDMSVQEAGLVLSRATNRDLGEGFVITHEGCYLGMGSIQDLMALLTEMQISAARYANPLTQLPGNVPVSRQIEHLLKIGQPFAACYFDIDHFKPFNDVYGYSKGDEIIQLLARLLVSNSDQQRDFIGHIGGDDFMGLFQSEDWRQRCGLIIDAFDREVPCQCSELDRRRGGLLTEDRKGNRVLHSLPALSIGALPVLPGCFASHHEISLLCAEAKKQAKKVSGSSCFVERRMPCDMTMEEGSALVKQPSTGDHRSVTLAA
ncbi:MAG: diguanylate cyclase protein [Proteobacteria bacterium]|nr:diguanylate cyclase protein [Pseudomonadota bacterium]